MFTTRPVWAAATRQVGLPAEKRGYLQHVGDLGHRRRVRRFVDVGQHRDADVSRTRRGCADLRPGRGRETTERRAVGLVVRGLEHVRHAAAGRDVANGAGDADGMRLALDDTWPRDQQQWPVANRHAADLHPAHEAYPATVAVAALPAGELVLVARVDEAGKERMGRQRLRLELGVELHGDVPRVRRQLDDLDELAVLRAADDLEPGFGQRPFVEQLNS